MTLLTLQQFRDEKVGGFAGWETAVLPGHENVAPYVEPVDARYGAPSFPFGDDPATAGAAFERWCAENLIGDYFVTASATGGLVYCRQKRDADLVADTFGTPSSFFGGSRREEAGR